MALEGKFTLQDFQKSMKQIRKLGSISGIMKMIPGMGKFADMMGDMNPDQDMNKIDGIINSMTPWERENPEKIDRSRRNRIAQGSGSDPADVNKLIKDFSGMAGMMKQTAGLGLRDRYKAIQEMAQNGMMNPNAAMQKQKVRPKRGPADPKKAEEEKRKKRKEAKQAKVRDRR